MGDNNLLIISLLILELRSSQGLEAKLKLIKSPVFKFIQICSRFFCVTHRTSKSYSYCITMDMTLIVVYASNIPLKLLTQLEHTK